MRNILTLTIAVALIGGAHAQTTANSSAQAAAHASANANIQTAVLLDARGRIVGEFNKAGQLIARGAVNTATQVQVVTQSGVRAAYALDGQIRSGAQASLDTVIVKSGQARASVNAAAQASVTAAQNARLLAGRTVTFTNASGQAVARVAANGTLTVLGDLRTATTATVQSGMAATQRFDLESELNASAAGALNLGTVIVEHGSSDISLTSFLSGAVQVGGHSSTDSNAGGSASGNAGLQIGVGSSASGNTGGTSGGISIGIGTGVGIGIGGK